MRAVSWLLGVLATLIVLTAVAAWFVPPWLDWTRYRGEIVALASGTLGRSVRIDGAISLTLLPEPVLTASNVSVDEGEAAISVKLLRLRVAPWPLLRGKLVARDVVMRDFDMHVPWPISTPPEAVRRPDWLSATSARIERGRVSIGDLAITDIDADLSTGAVGGSYAASGTARLSGKPWHVSMRMSQPGGDGSVGLDVALDGQGPVQGIGATLSGQIDGDGTLGGRVTARGPDLSVLLPAPAVAFKADGRLTIAGGLAAADDLNVEIGGSPARGAVALRVSPSLRLDVALAASRLDLDAWLPTLLSGAGVPVPTGIDLSAEAARLAGGTLRRLRGAFDIDRAGVEVRDIAATLPGDAAVTLAGRISHPSAGHPHFEGEATLSAPSLRTTLGWLEGAGFGVFSALPDGVLRTAELAGHAALDTDHLALTSLSGRIDGATVAGKLAVQTGKRLMLSASLEADRIDLDPWLPTEMPSLAAIRGSLAANDADLRIVAGTARFRGLDIAPFSLDAGIDEGQVTLRRLEGTARNVNMAASGTLVDGGRIADGRLDVQTRQASTIADMMPDSVTRHVGTLLRGPLAVQVQASGPPEALGLRVAADLGDLRLEAQPVLDLPSGKWAGPMTLRHPGAPRLAEMLGLAGAHAWLGDGSLSLVARVGGEKGRVSADDFEITAGALHASGHLSVDATGAEPLVAGRVSAETLPFPLPYARAPEPLSFDMLNGWAATVGIEAGHVLVGSSPVAEKLSANIILRDRTLHIDKLAARLGGGALAGAITLSTASPVPSLAVTLGLTGASVAGPIFDLPMDLTAGTVDGTLSVTATGYSPSALMATLHGQGTLAVRNGELAAFDMARLSGNLSDADVRDSLMGGITAFDTLDVAASVDRGNIVLGPTRMRAASGEATASGTISLPGASADLRVVIRPDVPDAPDIGLRLTGPLDALGRTPELADMTRWRLARAAPATP